MTNTTNDNGPSPVSEREGPDAHGQAGLLLVESLIHGLIARSVIRLEDAIEVVTVALDVKMEIIADEGEQLAAVDKALTLLSAIRDSLNIDAA